MKIKIVAKTIILIITLTLIATPFLIFAQDAGYVPLAPIPGVTPEAGEKINLVSYLSGAFAILIGIAGVLAVIVIMIGGIQYITTDSFTGKEEGKEKITKAVLGLILAIAAYLILYTINPNILSLRIGIEPLPPIQPTPPQPTLPKYSIEVLQNTFQKKQFSCSYDFSQRGDEGITRSSPEACQLWLAEFFQNDRFARKVSETMWLREQFEGPSQSCQAWRCFGPTVYALNGDVEETSPDQCVGDRKVVMNYRTQIQFNTPEECEEYVKEIWGSETGPPACQYFTCKLI